MTQRSYSYDLALILVLADAATETALAVPPSESGETS